MSRAVLISINPKWCELIAHGQKTIEVRKTRPKMETPFKVYIYCTKAKDKAFFTEQVFEKYAIPHVGNGKVIGEFVCDKITEIKSDAVYSKVFGGFDIRFNFDIYAACLTEEQIFDYLGEGKGYGWHISDLVIYDKPKELSEFTKPCIYGEESDVSCFLCDKSGYRPDMHIDCFNTVTRPPQSWCYVEEVPK